MSNHSWNYKLLDNDGSHNNALEDPGLTSHLHSRTLNEQWKIPRGIPRCGKIVFNNFST